MESDTTTDNSMIFTGRELDGNYFWNWTSDSSSSSSSASSPSSSTSYYDYEDSKDGINDFDSQLIKAEDVSVDAVFTSLTFNAIVFVLLMIMYECLRRILPAVYSSRKKQLYALHGRNNPNSKLSDQQEEDDDESKLDTKKSSSDDMMDHDSNNANRPGDKKMMYHDRNSFLFPSRISNSSSSSSIADDILPDEPRPLDWVGPVFGVPWNHVRQKAGLDGYFFLRYIRMNVRITALSTVWFFIILIPLYVSGSNKAPGWYYLSAVNVTSKQMWIPCIMIYLFSAFIFFVIKQEYKHFLEVRQDFLARGSKYVNPQHHYSLMVENIPYELRSEQALADYFHNLFPNSVHSASIIMKLPDLEDASNKCMRSCRRLEKSIAYLYATNQRPTHIVGRGRLSILGIDLAPLECCPSILSDHNNNSTDDDEDGSEHSSSVIPYNDLVERSSSNNILKLQPSQEQSERGNRTIRRGTRVDSISYYTHELAAHSRLLFRLQRRKNTIAATGNSSIRAEHWLDRVVKEASIVANQILYDSVYDNALQAPSNSNYDSHAIAATIPQAEAMTSSATGYGTMSSIAAAATTTPYRQRQRHEHLMQQATTNSTDDQLAASCGSCLMESQQKLERQKQQQEQHDDVEKAFEYRQSTPEVDNNKKSDNNKNNNNISHEYEEDDEDEILYSTPFARALYKNKFRRWAGRLGLDFVVAICRALNKQIDVSFLEPIVATMSSTGFVTFLDLSSTTCAASAPLTVKAHVLNVSVAPEPREIIWENAHVSKKLQIRRERVVNIILSLGVILWSFPLTAIQVFARAENLAQIPGMEWILYANGGAFTRFVNGYLPVVALLGLILILPVIFEYVAVKYERRKTYSDVQASMLGRYFYYQLANIYVSVTAGSILKSLADILDRPSSILQLLGESLPMMVGYFVALLVTKILAGLPMIFLRFGALSRMLFLRLLADEKKLTQREMDAVYRLENVQYGWEFPTQLLVVVIVFTYAIICPVILPFGLLYFTGALVVYKKQVLYVYSPVYESGGSMFPLAVQHTLFGLVCAQLTFLGYTVIRGCYYQPFFLFPLPIITIYAMNYLKTTYAIPSQRLSLERARECDRLSSLQEYRKSVDGETPRVSQPPTPLSPPVLSVDHGVLARKIKFNKNSYRQPVLAESPSEPWTYRRGLPDDAETVKVRAQLRQMNRFQFAQRDAQKQGRMSNLQSNMM